MRNILEVDLRGVELQEIPHILKEIGNQILHDGKSREDYPAPWNLHGLEELIK